jgi:hypothetical protein
MGGTWQSGQRNVYYFLWNGTTFEQNILTKEPLPFVDTPTFTLTEGTAALSLDYSDIVLGNADSSAMQISTDNVSFTDVPTYVSGVDGSIDGLTDNQLYYVRITSTKANYQSASATEQASASVLPKLSTPSLSLTAQNDAIGYVVDAQNANSTGGLMEIATQSNYSDAVTVDSADYTYASNAQATGTLTKFGQGGAALVSGTTYYVRFKNTASGYIDSAYATDSAAPYTILLEDTFSTGTIDSAIWDVLNPSTSIVTIQETGGNLSITTNDTGNTSNFIDYVISKQTFDVTQTVCVIINLQNTLADVFGRSTIGLNNGSFAYRAGNVVSDAGNNKLIAAYENSVELDSSNFTLDLSSFKSVKILIESGNTKVYEWVTDWVLIDTLTTTYTDANVQKLCFEQRSTTNGATSLLINHVYVTDADVLTETPQ